MEQDRLKELRIGTKILCRVRPLFEDDCPYVWCLCARAALNWAARIGMALFRVRRVIS